MELVDRLNRVRVRLAGAYRRLADEGVLTEEELETALETIGRLEKLSPDEIRTRLANLGKASPEAGWGAS